METLDGPALVFSCDFDERTAYEVEQKGWFEAVKARLPNGIEIPLSFRDPVRLSQDLEDEVRSGGCCIAEPALIIIPKVTRTNMMAAVVQLYRDGFFDRLAAIGVKGGTSRERSA